MRIVVFFNCGSFALDALWCLDLDAVTGIPGWTAVSSTEHPAVRDLPGMVQTDAAAIAIQKPDASQYAGG
jgi:hypothetical protein